MLTIWVIALAFCSCKDKAKLKAIDNEESLGKSNLHLVDDSEKLIELSNYILTGIEISDLSNKQKSIIKKYDKSSVSFTARNQALLDELNIVSDSLNISILESPSESMASVIDNFRKEQLDDKFLEMYANWMQDYTEKLGELASWMIQSSENKLVITLGANVNSYTYALSSELSSLKK
jgi:hypothetical protein